MSNQKRQLREQEICGHSVNEVLLTPEELAMDLTVDRCMDLSNALGECIFEDTGFMGEKGELLFAGFIMGRHPYLTDKILEITNGDCYEYMNLEDVFWNEDVDDAEQVEKSFELFLVEFCEFVNKTVATKERFNICCMSLMYYYKKKVV